MTFERDGFLVSILLCQESKCNFEIMTKTEDSAQ